MLCCNLKVSYTILPYYSTVLILSKNFQFLSMFNVNVFYFLRNIFHAPSGGCLYI